MATINMQKPKYLCGYPDAQSWAKSYAWVDISALVSVVDNVGNTKTYPYWAKMGMLWQRVSGQFEPEATFFVETGGLTNGTPTYNQTPIVIPGKPPTFGQEHTYQIELWRPGGIWYFFLDGQYIMDRDDYADFWKTYVGTSAQWSGETYNREDRMSGSLSQPCIFKDCKYYPSPGTGYMSTDWVGHAVVNESDITFGGEVTGDDSMNIWDLRS